MPGPVTRFRLLSHGRDLGTIETTLLGRHNVENILGAAAVLLGDGSVSVPAFKAAIAACHCQPVTPDWPQILALYSRLLHYEPTPVVALNRAVALAETGQVTAALHLLADLGPELQDYQPFHAVNANLLARAGQSSQAIAAFGRAIDLAASAADANFLIKLRDKQPN